MATKKKSKKKTTKPKKPASKKVTSTKKPAKKGKAPRELTKKGAAPKKTAAKTKSVGRKTVIRKTAIATKKRMSERSGPGAVAFSRQDRGSRSGEQSGDLQELSNVEAADSESVDELLEEGNAFEADVISGVQAADDADEQEVHTHEVPEDDVPGEYLDEE
jgi:hypothetical protein